MLEEKGCNFLTSLFVLAYMKSILTITILLITSSIYSQNFLTDISVTSGVGLNSSVTYEKFSDYENEKRLEWSKYHTSSWQWKPFIALQTSLAELHLKQQKKERSLALKLEGGFFFHQVFRNHYFDGLRTQQVGVDTSLWHIHGSPPLRYSTRSNNLGIRLGVILIKKWSPIFDFEYGLTYRINYAFLQRKTFHEQPEDISWRDLKYPKSLHVRSHINQEVHYYIGAIFKLNRKLSIGISAEVPSLFFGYLSIRNKYPIAGNVNNFMNRNTFFGLKCAYRLK